MFPRVLYDPGEMGVVRASALSAIPRPRGGRCGSPPRCSSQLFRSTRPDCLQRGIAAVAPSAPGSIRSESVCARSSFEPPAGSPLDGQDRRPRVLQQVSSARDASRSRAPPAVAWALTGPAAAPPPVARLAKPIVPGEQLAPRRRSRARRPAPPAPPRRLVERLLRSARYSPEAPGGACRARRAPPPARGRIAETAIACLLERPRRGPAPSRYLPAARSACAPASSRCRASTRARRRVARRRHPRRAARRSAQPERSGQRVRRRRPPSRRSGRRHG